MAQIDLSCVDVSLNIKQSNYPWQHCLCDQMCSWTLNMSKKLWDNRTIWGACWSCMKFLMRNDSSIKLKYCMWTVKLLLFTSFLSCVSFIIYSAINYDEKDPFLCNACGYCKYAKFDFTLTSRPCCAVDPIENDDDRKKVGIEIYIKYLY